MKIEIDDIAALAKEINLTFVESEDSFIFKIEKEDHGFEVVILKSGQYIFVSLLIGKREFPVEHIEHYLKESKEEVFEELIDNLNQLNNNSSRFRKKKNWLGTKIRVEIKINDHWVHFGYPGIEI